MKNYLHIETYYSDESCGIKDICGVGNVDSCEAYRELFTGIKHITEEHYPLISNIAAELLQGGKQCEKKTETILIFAIEQETQTCIWCVSIRERKNKENQYGINILNMDSPMQKETYPIEYKSRGEKCSE